MLLTTLNESDPCISGGLVGGHLAAKVGYEAWGETSAKSGCEHGAVRIQRHDAAAIGALHGR